VGKKEERPKAKEWAKVSILPYLFYPFMNLTKYRSPKPVVAAITARSGSTLISPPPTLALPLKP